MTSPRWMERAACAGPEIGDVFFAPDHEMPKAKDRRIAQAKVICAGCPVQEQCLAYATANDEEHGIWGGLTEKERGAARTRRKPTRRVELKHGTPWAAQRHRNNGEAPCTSCKDAVNRKMQDWKRKAS